jgi:hypothetical protein
MPPLAGGRFEATKNRRLLKNEGWRHLPALEDANITVTLEMLDAASTRFRKSQFNARICGVPLNWKSDFVGGTHR